jgi:hypothetical protein
VLEMAGSSADENARRRDNRRHNSLLYFASPTIGSRLSGDPITRRA